MAERPKLSGRQIKELFYTEVEDDKRQSIDSTDGSKMTYRCRCGKVRTQSLKHGYTNLAQHVHVKHPEWVAAVMEDASIAPKLASALQASPVASEPAQKRAKRAPRAANKTSSRNGRASIGNDDSASADAGAGSSPQSPARDVSPKQVKEAQDASPKRVKRPLSSSTESESEMTPAKPSPPPSSAKSTPVQQQSLKAATVSPLAATAAAAKPTGVQKRDDYLSWDDYFMSVAFLSAMRSKDPSTQVGACIVSSDKKIVGIGYNGFPNGCSDDKLPWARSSVTGSPLDTKYPYVCHAEMNAILNKNATDLKGCTIYVALFPCNECAKLIIQSGIKRVVYYSDKYNGDWKFEASRRLLDMAEVTYHQHRLQVSELLINFASVQ